MNSKSLPHQKPETSSNGSLIPSRSSTLFQLSLPAVRRAAFTRSGVASGYIDMYKAAAPATCGEAMEVPLILLYPPSFQVDRMQTPGAMMSTSAPKLLKSANVSSTSTWQVGLAPPPGSPLKSARAETVITSS